MFLNRLLFRNFFIFPFVFKLWCILVLLLYAEKKSLLRKTKEKHKEYIFSVKYVKFTETILSSLILIIHEVYSKKNCIFLGENFFFVCFNRNQTTTTTRARHSFYRNRDSFKRCLNDRFPLQ